MIQVKTHQVAQMLAHAETTGVSELLSLVGQSTDEDSLLIQTATHNLRFERSELEHEWSKVG